MSKLHSTGGFDWIAAALSWVVAYLAVVVYGLALWGYITTSVPPSVVASVALWGAVLLLCCMFLLRLSTGRGRSAFGCLKPRYVTEALVLPGIFFVPQSLWPAVWVFFCALLGFMVAERICWFLAGRLREYRQGLPVVAGRTARNDPPVPLPVRVGSC